MCPCADGHLCRGCPSALASDAAANVGVECLRDVCFQLLLASPWVVGDSMWTFLGNCPSGRTIFHSGGGRELLLPVLTDTCHFLCVLF